MADTIFTRALAQAAAVQGSNQALAYQLHVPENTLLRWMSGRAQMPLRAFRRVIELLVEHEKSARAELQPPAGAAGEKLDFNIGEVLARCARCGGTQFAPAIAQTPLKMTSALLCCSCTFSVDHGELLAELASQAIQHSRALAALRKRPKAPAQPSAKVIRLGRR
jgi:hypothetical protein